MKSSHGKALLCRTSDGLLAKWDVYPRAARLCEQCRRQVDFCEDARLRAPVVRRVVDGGPLHFRFDMDFIEGKMPLVTDQADEVAGLLSAWVMRNLARCTEAEVYVLPKVQAVRALAPSEFDGPFAALADYFSKPVQLPFGHMHGDLTFCNTILSGERVYLVDFLDGFVESPLMDMVKLRQDTAHGWAALFYPELERSAASAHVDEMLDSTFRECVAYREHYQAFQLLNLLRIVPYVSDARVLGLLEKEVALCMF